MLGASEYSKIKTKTPPKMGQTGETVALKSKFGWIIISFGQGFGISNLCLLNPRPQNHNLCKLDELGLDNENGEIAERVYNRFKERLSRSLEG